ncbi:Gram-negative porin [Marinobacter sp. DSM 26671]|jgi:predicted porin|nr:porin [Marinobacter sp. DSM 26671]MBI47782.1 porin [Marinobacter sp.]PTB99990.1 porin [Marinobacter sp. Z-F4-2]HAZ88691.1 porin [Marinobacter adhaerens]SFD93990.1 Gram-negative porin [Marinobacter sp. DSM 26671]HBI80157.1 porin [Marinobacter adhaerens]|tara:strand:+ start:2482 stop:3609 length:1128 start_codon:yes stop_codon:yes gene_type:complete
MIENNNVFISSNNRSFRKAPMAAALVLAAGVSSPVMAEVSFESDNGWKAGFNGHIPIFAVFGNYDEPTDEDSFTITTGFNPATLQTNIYAPTQNGLEVSGHFQMNANIAPGDANTEFRSRVSEIAVAGDFGKVNIGKGFGIYGVPAIGDNGSALGVGLIGGPDQVAATAGRIGNGYFYANFTPRVMYTSNNLGGLQFKVGLFSPSKVDGVTDAEYTMPRIEANVVYSGDNFSLWSSGFTQDVDSKIGTFDDYTMSGIDFGGSVSLGGLSVRGNYGITQGTGNGVFAARLDPNEEDASQWYVETTYQIKRTTLGVSYGEGEDDFIAGDGDDTDLTMLFARYAATDHLTLMAEYTTLGTGNGQGEYDAIIFGSQLTF